MVLQRVKYNPAFLSEDDLVRSFVVRHADLDLIVQVIRENVSESNQHILVTGPRGAGKTSLALRAAAEVRRDEQLRDKWYPLVFAEESYQVSSPGEFWLEALFHLHKQTGDVRWQQTHDELLLEQDETRLRERALAQLMDFADAEGKRILLVVENFGMLIGHQISHDDAWVLRHTLMNEPRIMMLATAISRFKQVENPGEALYELFRHQQLPPLDTAECLALWTSITGAAPPDARIRPIQILTGGNPRLLAIISSFGARLSFKELMDDLMQLVDEHTEYFKRHLDDLPPTERKVYLALTELWDPATARDVARAARLDVSKASSFLNRLITRGAVVVLADGGRTKSYQVAERMYNVYYMMRRRGTPSDRVKAAVNFMARFYAPKELVSLAQRIAEEACTLDAQSRREHFFAYDTIIRNIPADALRYSIVTSTPTGFFTAPDCPDVLKHWASLAEAQHSPHACTSLPPEPRPTDSLPTPSLTPSESEDIGHKLKELLEEADAISEQPERSVEAERLYRKAIDIAPDKALPWAKLGVFCVEQAQYERAESHYRKAIELDPTAPWAWALLGELLHEFLAQYTEAEGAYRRAIELNPKAACWVQLGKLLHERPDRYEEAEAAYRKAIDIEPENAWAYAQLGKLLHECLERHEEAEAAYRQAIQLEPKYAWAHAHLGKLLHECLERYEEAEAAYRKAIDLEPESAWVHLQLGTLLHKRLERYEEAEAAYRKAIDLEPESAWVHLQLGTLLHEDLERFDAAEACYRTAIELAEEPNRAWYQLGLLLHHKLERFSDAELAYRKAIELEPQVRWGWAALGQLLHEHLERYEDAEAAYRKAIELYPEFAWAWAHLGNLLQEPLKKYQDAEAAYRKAIELEPNRASIWADLASLLHVDPERHEEAEAAYRRAIELDAKYARAWALLGALLHERSERYDEAEAAYRKAIELEPHSGVWTSLGLLLHECLGRYEEAEAAYRKAIELDGEDALLWLMLGVFLRQHGDRLDEAEAACRRALEIDPRHVLARRELLSLLLERPGRLDDALRVGADYLTENPEDPIVLNGLAWALYQDGRRSSLRKGEELARRAVANDPDNANRHHTLACILTASGKGAEALDAARRYLDDTAAVKDTVDDGIRLFVTLAAAGHAREALDILSSSPSASLLEPLVVGLRLFLGEDVKVAVEILEVAKDVFERIEARREELAAPRPE